MTGPTPREDLSQVDTRELIERSSVNSGAAASYRARATAQDYRDAETVLDLVDTLDPQET